MSQWSVIKLLTSVNLLSNLNDLSYIKQAKVLAEVF